MTRREILKALFDPAFDVSAGGWRIIDIVKEAVVNFDNRLSDIMIRQLLLRIRIDSPHVFAITVGQFIGYENIERDWENGFVDSRGMTWLARKT